MIRAIFFDLNGVLITSEFLSKRFEEKYNIPQHIFIEALTKIMSTVRNPNAPKIFKLLQPYFQEWGIDLKEAKFLNFWFSGETIDTKVLNYITELREKNVLIFVISNNFRERTDFYRIKFPEIFRNIEKAYFSHETGYVKPSKKALQLILQEYNLLPEAVIYFDDSKDNSAVANEIGIDGQLWSGLESAKEYINLKLQ